jgi:hypothetical protein
MEGLPPMGTDPKAVKKKKTPPIEAMIGLLHAGWNDPAAGVEWIESHRSHQLSPEHELLVAMLEDAFICALAPLRPFRCPSGQKTRQEIDRAEARAWIHSRSYAWAFTFNNVCEYLNLSPSKVRQAIEAEYSKAA